MKPITQFNFREIVGQFIMVKIDNFNPDYQYYVGYCYIDPQFGISVRICGAVVEDGIKEIPDGIITVRCTENMDVEIYNNITEDMHRIAEAINELYVPDWIIAVRAKEEYDPYRDRIYVDDLLIPIGTYTNKEIQFEPLWIKPYAIINGTLYGKTIESGKVVEKDTEVAIMDRASFGKLFEEISDVLGIDQNLAMFLERSIPKEETDEIQEETT